MTLSPAAKFIWEAFKQPAEQRQMTRRQLLTIVAELEGDARRLQYLMNEIEGFCHLEKDRFDYACELAEREGRDEINETDELNGFRLMIDDAIAAELEGEISE